MIIIPSAAVWTGYKSNERFSESLGNPSAVLWREVMRRIHDGLENKDFNSCSGLVQVTVCQDSGLLATEDCALDCRSSRVYSALVAADNAPSAYCGMHTSPIYTVTLEDENGNVITHCHGGDGHTHAHPHTHTQTKAVINRLARAIGHLESVKRMVEDGRDCAEVLIQLAAVRSALNNTAKIILKDHIDHCLADAVETGDQQAIDELNQAIEKFMN